jgi:PAS domain S-box-containing protein
VPIAQNLQNVDATELARCLFDESNDALLVFDPSTLQLIDVNRRAEQLTRLSREQLLSLKLPDLFDAESPELLQDFFAACQHTRVFHSAQAFRLACDGSEQLEGNVTVSRLNTKPNLLGLVAVKDVSNVRKQEANLVKPQTSLLDVVGQQSVHPGFTSQESLASEKWLQELVNDVDAIVWQAELPTWRFTYVSQQAEKILGYPVSQWLNEVDFWVNHLHDVDRKQAVEFCTHSTERGEDHEFDYRVFAKDGRIVWLHEIVRVIKDASGTPSCLRGVMIDITDRKNAEEALRESEEQRRRAEEIALVMKVNVGLDGRWLKVSPSFCDYLGYSKEELIGRHSREMTHVDDRAEDARQCARLLAGEINTFEREKRHHRRDGRIVWSYVNCSRVVNRAGEPQFFKTYIRDITEERSSKEALLQSEARLRQSEQRLKHLISNCPVGLYICKASGDYAATFVSETISSQTGYETEEFLDDPGFWATHIHPDDRESVMAGLAILPEQGRVSHEYRFRHKNGTYRWMYDESSMLLGRDGQPEEIVGFWMDVTERKLAEEQLRQKESQLAHVSRLSTMGEMVAGIAHEINQPLSAIANFAAAANNALAAMNFDDESPIATWLQQVNAEAVRCGDIIRRLRKFVKKDEEDRKSVDLNQVVRDAVALIESTLHHQSITIDCKMPDSGPQVMVNQVQLQQVLVNLLRNACDAVRESTTPRINIHVDLQDGHAHLSIQDNGPGVEEHQRQRLFDAFFTTKKDGMGMGLPISKSIVEAHGGSLRFDPGTPRGARFHMELPVAEAAKASETDVG